MLVRREKYVGRLKCDQGQAVVESLERSQSLLQVRRACTLGVAGANALKMLPQPDGAWVRFAMLKQTHSFLISWQQGDRQFCLPAGDRRLCTTSLSSQSEEYSRGSSLPPILHTSQRWATWLFGAHPRCRDAQDQELHPELASRVLPGSHSIRRNR